MCIGTCLTVFVSMCIAQYTEPAAEIHKNIRPTRLGRRYLLRKNHYPFEDHQIETEDGYILGIHRIPQKNGVPIFLQHGLLLSSTDWLKNGPNRSLAYLLWDEGYDVWLGNFRGNAYSRKHKTLSPKDKEFWDFSWHELGYYDMPAAIHHIRKTTGKDMFYVGYSMGGGSFSIMASQRPDAAKHIRAMIGLAPAIYEYHMTQPLIRFLSVFWKELKFAAKLIGLYEFAPQGGVFDTIFNDLCNVTFLRDWACSGVISYVFGYNPPQLDYSRIPEYLGAFPMGTSINVIWHWFQYIRVNEFRNFDHGREKNLQLYHQEEPPKYDLTKIQIPVATFTSDNDAIVDIRDIKHFYEQIPNKLGIYDLSEYGFNHVDFVWGLNATEYIYQDVLRILRWDYAHSCYFYLIEPRRLTCT
ncbi:unnamed protein product [Trichogramma brassicae]|uniref:Lipase n=1 Tax=Trichogramma brassicae TaxID=86971 RepID=A0A6H5IEF6_9HYME|nr:unnamed protein product [Trichogramma brassicae]